MCPLAPINYVFPPLYAPVQTLDPISKYSQIRLLKNELGTSPVDQLVNNLPAKWEPWVRSLGWEDPLEKLPTPVFWLGEFPGIPWGHKELNTTE